MERRLRRRVGYVSLGGVFTSHLTGNTFRIAVALVTGRGATDLVRRLAMLAGFAAGGVLGTIVLQRRRGVAAAGTVRPSDAAPICHGAPSRSARRRRSFPAAAIGVAALFAQAIEARRAVAALRTGDANGGGDVRRQYTPDQHRLVATSCRETEHPRQRNTV